MFLTKYRPHRELGSVLENDFFPMLRWFDGSEEGQEAFRLPKTNINESDSAYELTMEMPGVEKKNVDVAIEKDEITITGGHTEKTESKGLLRREIRSQRFRRTFVLDGSIDREKVTAKLENGVLTVSLPKKGEAVGRKINID